MEEVPDGAFFQRYSTGGWSSVSYRSTLDFRLAARPKNGAGDYACSRFRREDHTSVPTQRPALDVLGPLRIRTAWWSRCGAFGSCRIGSSLNYVLEASLREGFVTQNVPHIVRKKPESVPKAKQVQA